MTEFHCASTTNLSDHHPTRLPAFDGQTSYEGCVRMPLTKDVVKFGQFVVTSQVRFVFTCRTNALLYLTFLSFPWCCPLRTFQHGSNLNPAC